MSDCLQPHRLQHARFPCPPLSPSLLKLMSTEWWCYLTMPSSAVPFFFCLQFFPASGSFPKSWLFASAGQRIGASASASVPPMNIQSWCLLELTGLISFCGSLVFVWCPGTAWVAASTLPVPRAWHPCHVSSFNFHTARVTRANCLGPVCVLPGPWSWLVCIIIWMTNWSSNNCVSKSVTKMCQKGWSHMVKRKDISVRKKSFQNFALVKKR